MRLVFALLVAVSPAFAQSIPNYTVKVKKTFGAIDGPVSFTAIGDVVTDAKGNIYIADPREFHVLALSPTGKLLRTIGRKGSGPGDLESVGALGWQGDSLWVGEFTGRVSLFAPDGKFARIVFQPAQIFGEVVGVTADGQALISAQTPGFATNLGSVFALVRAASNRVDTIYSVPQPHYALNVFSNGRPVMGTQQPFTDDPLVIVSGDGRRAALIEFPPPDRSGQGHYTITLMSLTQAKPTVLRKQSFAYRAQPLTKRMIDDWLNSMAASEMGPYAPKNKRKVLEEALYKPKWVRPIESGMFTDDGNLWVTMHVDRPDQEVRMLDAHLRPYGELRVPSREGYLLRAGGNTAWLVAWDDEEIPYLKRASLQKQPSRVR